MTTETRSCRLCDENNDKMYSIFEKCVFNINIINVIRDFIPIPIYENDPCSKYICHSCNENLNMFCEFKKSCIDIAMKHKEDLQNNDQTAAVSIYLDKFKDFEDPFSHTQLSESEILDSVRMDCDDNSTPESDPETEKSSSADNVTLRNVSLQLKCSSECGMDMHPKPRVSGPKSKTNLYEKLVKTEQMYNQPLRLLQLVVQTINVQNIPDFEAHYSTEDVHITETVHYCCRYCEDCYEDETSLAIHELQSHIQLHLSRVDEGPTWTDAQDEFKLRNAWVDAQEDKLNTTEESITMDTSIDDGKDLLVLIEGKVDVNMEIDPDEKPPTLDLSRNSIIYFVGSEAYAKGVPLKSIPKEVRNTFYQSVKMGGLKKRFCQLCRFTFKDNWSMDNHYLQQNCFYTCNYCGMKFKRSKEEYPAHLKAHEAAGHKKSMNVFNTTERGLLREYDASCLKPYVPMPTHPQQRQQLQPPLPLPSPSLQQQQSKPPPPKPTPMKLRVRQLLSPPAQFESPPIRQQQTIKIEPQGNKSTNEQAFFCKTCFQVFTKLGQYNTHVGMCKGTSDSQRSTVQNHNSNNMGTPVGVSNKTNQQGSSGRLAPKKMPALNPLPIPPIKIKQENGINGIVPAPADNFPCNFCTAVFKSVYSRNSHMRMHVKNKQTTPQAPIKQQKRPASSPVVPPAKKIKPESFEPIVEIHEGATTTIGSVSITPLKRVTSTNSGVNADVLKLVQNNPNITFKPRTPPQTAQRPVQVERAKQVVNVPTRSPVSGDDSESGKGYKCASCSQLFANKSNLYFHKKNQCTGSRFPCPFCKKRFGTANEYSSHIYYSHPE